MDMGCDLEGGHRLPVGSICGLAEHSPYREEHGPRRGPGKHGVPGRDQLPSVRTIPLLLVSTPTLPLKGAFCPHLCEPFCSHLPPHAL